MSELPHGRFSVKFAGKPFAARTYHLYKDCGIVNSAAHMPGATVFEPSDEIVAMMEMTVCKACDTRANTVAPEDVIFNAIAILSTSDAQTILEALSEHGYVIRRERKRAPAE